MKEYETYLFDIDGTLLNTMELIYRTFEKTCRVHRDMDVTRDYVFSHIGIPLAAQMEMFLGPLGDELDDILNFHMDYQAEIYPQYLEIFPGVIDTLSSLKQQGKELGIVTSRTRPSLMCYLEHFNLDHFFSVIATPECTAAHKPSPEPVLWAMEQACCKPSETLFVGDAYVDINSGTAAGVETAFASWGPNKVEDLPIKPTWILDSMKQLIS